MRTLVVLSFLVALLSVAPARAQYPNDDPDIVGLFFDPGGQGICLFTGAPATFDLYYVLLNPTNNEGIDAYEFTLGIDVPQGWENSIFLLESRNGNGVAQGIDVGDKTFPLRPEYVVGLATPIPAAWDVMVLHSWSFFLQENIEVYFSLFPAEQPSLPGDYPVVQWTGVGLAQVGYFAGPGIQVFSASVNGACPVAVESTTFGTLKALYR